MYALYQIWRWYIKYGRCRYPYPAAEKLRFFLEINKLYETDYQEKHDRNGKTAKEKYISNSACLCCSEDEKVIRVRFIKQGDRFTDKVTTLDTGLKALFKLDISKKLDTNGFCEYTFDKTPDSRLNLVYGMPDIKNTTIPITEKISLNVSSVSHGLTIGNTGSGKSFFIFYKILAYMKMKAFLYIADPKSADLSLIKYIKGFENRVACEPNQIARLLREMSEVMEERYKTYFSDTSAFGKTYIDFELPPVVFIFDEFAAFIKTVDKKLAGECMSYLYSIVLKGRAAGCFIELILQRPDASLIDGAIRDQLGCRVLLGNASKEGYVMCFGTSDVDHKTITVKGGGYIKIDGQGEEKYFETPFIKDLDFIKELTNIYSHNTSRQSFAAGSSGCEAIRTE